MSADARDLEKVADELDVTWVSDPAANRAVAARAREAVDAIRALVAAIDTMSYDV